MKRIVPVAILAVLIVAGVAISLSVGGGESQAQPSRAVVEAAVWDALEEDAQVAVMTSLRPSDLSIADWTPQSMAEHADMVQANVLSVLTVEEFDLEARFKIAAALFGLINKSGVEKLSTHPDVVDIALGGQYSAGDLIVEVQD